MRATRRSLCTLRKTSRAFFRALFRSFFSIQGGFAVVVIVGENNLDR